MKSLIFPACCAAAFVAVTETGHSQAQSTPLASYDQQNSVLRLDWVSPKNRTFFPQVSTDLVSWDYIGALHFGPGSHVGMIQSTAPKTFAKLRYSDLPVVTEAEAKSADFDLDGLTNIFELENSHTDPLVADTDKDGLPDGWEVGHGISPRDNGSIDPANGPDGEFGGGGGFSIFSVTTNSTAFGAGVGSHPAATLADLDGDGIPNERDAAPQSFAIDWETDGKPVKFLFAPLPGYDYSIHGSILGCNDLGDVIASKALYFGGSWHILGQIETDSTHPLPSKVKVNGNDHDAYVEFQPLASSVSNNGQIVGSATVKLYPYEKEVGPDQFETFFAASTRMAFIWDSWAATPRLLAHGAGGVINGNYWDEDAQIAADGSSTVRRRADHTVYSPASYVVDRYTLTGVSTTPIYSNIYPGVIGNSGFLAFNEGASNAYSWMPGAGPVSLLADSLFSTANPRSNFQQFAEPTYLGEKPGPPGGYCINFWGKAMIRNGGKWMEAVEMGDATLVTRKGVAFRGRTPNAVKVWNSGNSVQTLNEAVPNKSFTGLNTYLIDSTSDGRVLISFSGGGQSGYGFLMPMELSAVFERDQVANRIPNPKRPNYRAITLSSNPEDSKIKYDNRLFVSTEPGTGKVEITVKHPSLPHSMAELLAVDVTDDAGQVVASAQCDESGLTEIDFLPLNSTRDKVYYFDISYQNNAIYQSHTKNYGFSMQIITPNDIQSQKNSLALVIGPFSNTVAGSFYQTFLGTAPNPTGAVTLLPEVRAIQQEPPTMIAGSNYDQSTWTTEIPSFKLPDGTGASNIAETYFSHQAGVGLHEICRNLMEQNHSQIWNEMTNGGIATKNYTFPISSGTGLSFYYSGLVPPKYIWGGATYQSGSVTLKLKKNGNKIEATGIDMQAVIEDYYDFDYTRPPDSFSNRAATIEIGFEEPSRPDGKIFHTLTEINFSYDESTGDLINGGVTNGGPPIPFFNANGHIQNGNFVTTGGGSSGGDE